MDKKEMKFEVREEDIAKPKKPRGVGKNSPVIGDNGVNLQQGDASKYAKILLELASWEKVDKTSVPALEHRFLEYINYCAENDIKLGNQVCYIALGISKDDVYNWEHGRSMTSAHCDFIKKIKSICAGNREFLMQDGKINPITGIFWQKNYDGLRDTQNIEISGNKPLGDTPNLEEIAKQLPQDIPIDTDFKEVE